MSDQQMILILIIAFFLLGCNFSCNGMKEDFPVDSASAISPLCRTYEVNITSCSDEIINTARGDGSCNDAELCKLREQYCPNYNYTGGTDFCNFANDPLANR